MEMRLEGQAKTWERLFLTPTLLMGVGGGADGPELLHGQRLLGTGGPRRARSSSLSLSLATATQTWK